MTTDNKTHFKNIFLIRLYINFKPKAEAITIKGRRTRTLLPLAPNLRGYKLIAKNTKYNPGIIYKLYCLINPEEFFINFLKKSIKIVIKDTMNR